MSFHLHQCASIIEALFDRVELINGSYVGGYYKQNSPFRMNKWNCKTSEIELLVTVDKNL